MDKNPLIDSDGTKRWHNEEGQLHREDGPAIECAHGNTYWYKNDQLHREDGPAREWSEGDKSWWLNGQLHREDGPAIERPDGYKSWWLNNKKLNEELHQRLTRGPLDLLPLYLGQGFDEYIGKRLRDE